VAGPVADRRRPDPRPIGPLQLLALGVNGIVGVGIFYAPADVAQAVPGWGSVAVFLLTGLALLPVALAFGVLGRRFDVDGGPVVYARAAFGELGAFGVGWIAYGSAVASTSAVMAGLAASVATGLGDAGSRLAPTLPALLATLIAVICAAGIVISARTWTALTLAKLLPLAALAIVFVAGGHVFGGAPSAHAAGAPAWLHAALRVIFTYQGFEIVPVLAGQVRAPERTVPFATLGSLVTAGALYVVLQAACVATLPGLARSTTPLAEAAAVIGGAGLATVVSWGTTLSALAIGFGMMVATPRYLAALSTEAGLGLGFQSFSALGVPLRALAVTWALVVALVSSGSRGELFDLAGVAVLVQYLATAAALGVLAHRRSAGLGPRHALLAVPALVVACTLVSGASAREWKVAGLAVLLGLVLRAAAVSSRRRGSVPPS